MSSAVEKCLISRGLFNAEFGDDDLILAVKKHTQAEGGCEPAPSVYTDPTVLAACASGAAWTTELTAALKKAGFTPSVVEDAARFGAASVEEGLYEAFQTDARTLKLREAAAQPRDLRLGRGNGLRAAR